MTRNRRTPKGNGSTERFGVLVVGMHRSGTSALTRVLSLLGCDLPATLMAGNRTNEPGHWESDVICRLNDRILDSAGSSWHDWGELNANWGHSPKAAGFREEAVELLAGEFGASRLFVLKDPRICRLAGFWIDVLRQAGIRPVVVSPLRNPLEVAASLRERNGFDLSLGHLLWLRHVLDGEFATRDVPRFHATYDRLMDDWSRVAADAAARLDIAWPRMSQRVAAEIGEFLSGRHRHHREPAHGLAGNAGLSAWLRDAHAIFARWAEAGEDPADFATLDRIRAGFNAAAPAFSHLVARGQEAALANRDLRRDLAGARDELAATRDRLAETEAGCAAARREAARLEDELGAAAGQLAHRAARISQLEGDIAGIEARAETAEQSLAATRDRLAETESALAQRRHEAEETAADLAAARAELRALALAREEADRLVAGFKEHVDLLIADLRERQQAAAAAEAARAELAAGLAGRDARIGELEARAAAGAGEMEALRAEAEAAAGKAQAERRALQARLDERFDEIASLTQLLQAREGEADRVRQAAAGELGRAVAKLVDGRRWRYLPGRVRLRRQMEAVRQSGVFDAEWYCRHYGDIAAAGVDPLRHYVEFGAGEGREPNAALAMAKGGAKGGAGNGAASGENT